MVPSRRHWRVLINQTRSLLQTINDIGLDGEQIVGMGDFEPHYAIA